jgi:hypothetical protein
MQTAENNRVLIATWRFSFVSVAFVDLAHPDAQAKK